MEFEPKTHEEEVALHKALLYGQRYEIEVQATIIILNEEELVRDALRSIEDTQFSNSEDREHMINEVRADPAQALGVLLRPGHMLETRGATSRESSYTIRLQ
ncbi:hypothetical protein ABZU76_45335 [Amycolatopsis sp. NPDC005232]|uniref:hypothetical protein n=1 Tax=Amycolatopsis sp. NPDC005232 TaxID=3157027 RepID=UPI0033A1BD95